MSYRLLLLIVSVLCLAFANPALAGTTKKNADDGTIGGTSSVSSVDAANSQITVKDDKSTTVYDVPLGTQITIDGNPADLSQLHSGMLINSFTEADGHSLSQIDCSAKSAPADPSSSSSGKKKKSGSSNKSSNSSSSNNNSDSNN